MSTSLDLKDADMIYQFSTEHDETYKILNETPNGTTYNLSDKMIDMDVDGSSILSCKIQTKEYFNVPYGNKMVAIVHARLLSNNTADSISRLGLFDDDDGIFIEYDVNNGMYVGMLNNGSEVKYLQSNWNEDKLNGTHASTLNLSEADQGSQFRSWVFIVDNIQGSKLQIGLLYEGKVNIIHSFVDPFKFGTSLPLRYMVENSSGVNKASFKNMVVYSMNKYSYIPKKISKSMNDPFTIGLNESKIMCALKLSTLVPKGKVRIKNIHITDIDSTNTSICEWKLVINSSSGVDVNYNPPNDESGNPITKNSFSFSDATSISGIGSFQIVDPSGYGTVTTDSLGNGDTIHYPTTVSINTDNTVASGYFNGPSTQTIYLDNVDLLLNNAIDNLTTDIVYLHVTCLSGASSILAGLSWEEFI
jgi:hypothetical protein